MNGQPKLVEIDITRQARALSWLRMSDYVLVLMCGYGAIGLMADALPNLLVGIKGAAELWPLPRSPSLFIPGGSTSALFSLGSGKPTC